MDAEKPGGPLEILRAHYIKSNQPWRIQSLSSLIKKVQAYRFKISSHEAGRAFFHKYHIATCYILVWNFLNMSGNLKTFFKLQTIKQECVTIISQTSDVNYLAFLRYILLI